MSHCRQLKGGWKARGRLTYVEFRDKSLKYKEQTQKNQRQRLTQHQSTHTRNEPLNANSEQDQDMGI